MFLTLLHASNQSCNSDRVQCGIIREIEPESEGRMPIIALTAISGAENRIRVLGAGIQLYLTKPVEPDELLVSVASLTGRLELHIASEV
jgi:DNA-binding response OmpR family regulator